MGAEGLHVNLTTDIPIIYIDFTMQGETNVTLASLNSNLIFGRGRNHNSVRELCT